MSKFIDLGGALMCLVVSIAACFQGDETRSIAYAAMSGVFTLFYARSADRGAK